MSLTVNAKTYTADDIQSQSVGYVGPANTLSVKDVVKLSRSKPKVTVSSSGVARAEAKMTRTLTLTGSLEPVRDAILAIAHSVPVGAAAADIDSMLNDMGAFLASAPYKTFVKSLAVNL